MAPPKVLIIGQPFNKDTGGGITLSNLFSGWKKDRLAVACSGYLLQDNIDTAICDTYYQLGHLEHSWLFPFSLLKRKYPSGVVKFQPNERMANLTIPKSKLRVKLIMNVLVPVLEYLGIIHFVSRMTLSPEFCDWLDKYQPDIVYTQAASLPDLSFCNAVHEYLRKKQVPFVFHMMDDWPSVISHKGPFKHFWYRRIDTELRKLLDRCSLLMSISDQMSEEYKARYSKDFVPFHNPIDLDFWKQDQRHHYELNNRPVILYAGRTGLGIDSSLSTVAKAVEEVNESLRISAKLVLQTGEKPTWVNQFSCVEHKPFVPYPELPKVFAEADFLLLPYDFSSKSIRFIRLSMPTKASEFMASGTPIIVFAPAETAVVGYAKAYGWGKIVTENNVELLSAALKQLILLKTERKVISREAKLLAAQRHDAGVVSRAFQQLIADTARAEILTHEG